MTRIISEKATHLYNTTFTHTASERITTHKMYFILRTKSFWGKEGCRVENLCCTVGEQVIIIEFFQIQTFLAHEIYAVTCSAQCIYISLQKL